MALVGIVLGLACLVLVHYGINLMARRASRSVGKTVGTLARPGLRWFLTAYYRRRVIQQLQAERKKQGIPPLENPYLD